MKTSLVEGHFHTIEPCFNRILLSKIIEYDARQDGYRGVNYE